MMMTMTVIPRSSTRRHGTRRRQLATYTASTFSDCFEKYALRIEGALCKRLGDLGVQDATAATATLSLRCQWCNVAFDAKLCDHFEAAGTTLDQDLCS
eukprot:455595-Amphidinium_carterae.1